MSATDRIRDEVSHIRREFGADALDSELGIELRLPEAEALCDLADAAYAWRDARPYCSCERPPAHQALRDAVDRLDGEDGDG